LAYAMSVASTYIPVGANNITGYSGVDLTGGFHSADAVLNILKDKSDPNNIVQLAIDGVAPRRVVGAILGSIEMAMHSNFLRKDYKMPSWDITTLGICLVRIQQAGRFEQDSDKILEKTMTNPVFVDCMAEWSHPSKLEPKFGTQADGKLKWYDNVKDEDELSRLECTGGRGSFYPPIGRLIEHYDVGQPRTFKVAPVCWTTKNGMCFPPPVDGKVFKSTCLYPTPGSADCGSDLAPCGVWGELHDTPACIAAKNSSQLDCAALTAPYTVKFDFAKYLCRDEPDHLGMRTHTACIQ